MGSFAFIPVDKLSQGSYPHLLPLITFCCGVIKVVCCFEREKHETCYLSFLLVGLKFFVMCHCYSLGMLFCAFSSHSRLFTVATCFVLCSYPLPRLIALAKGGFVLCSECLLCMAQKRDTLTHIRMYIHTNMGIII